MAVSPEPDHFNTEQPFIAHLVELRGRLLRIVAAITIVLVILLPFANRLYTYVATPLLACMPKGTSMIATGVTDPFMAPFKLTVLAAIVITIPYTLYQVWGFIAPGLYLRERQLALPLLISSTLLFYIGMAFAYYVVFPMIFGFFVATAPQGVAVMTDINQYLGFVLTLFLAFGTAFEVPIATILLVWMGILTTETLVGQRRFVILGAFVISMFLTPPDAFSQTLLAVPMWLLFEVGVFFAPYFTPKPQSSASSSDSDAAACKLVSNTTLTNFPLLEAETTVTNIPVTLSAPADAAGYHTLTDEEMEAELNAAAIRETQITFGNDDELSLVELQVEFKLKQVHTLRQAEDYTGARTLLYEVLSEGNEQQRVVARNILEQLDTL